MKNNENVKDIIDTISDMILEYIKEERIKNSNKNTS